MQTGNVVFGPTHPSVPPGYTGCGPHDPTYWLAHRMLSDPQGYRIEQLEQEVKRLKARIAELEATPYHGEWAAG